MRLVFGRLIASARLEVAVGGGGEGRGAVRRRAAIKGSGAAGYRAPFLAPSALVITRLTRLG